MQQSRLNQMETADNAEDNPASSNFIERNSRTIIGLRLKAAHERGLQVGLNTGSLGVQAFDPDLCELLTMIVSPETYWLKSIACTGDSSERGVH